MRKLVSLSTIVYPQIRRDKPLLHFLVKAIRFLTNQSMAWQKVKLNYHHRPSPELLREIQSFRKKTMLTQCPYLFDENHYHLVDEDTIDSISTHICMYKKSKLVGYLRLNSFQSELHSLFPETDISSESEKLEISRFSVAKHERGLGKYLLIHAGIFQYLETGAVGLVALCPHRYINKYLRFGLTQKYKELTVPNRPHNYSIMSATTKEMAMAVLYNLSQLILNKPLRKNNV